MDAALLEQLKQPTVTVKVASKLLGLGLNAGYRGVAKGDIPSVKIGGAIKIPSAPLRKMLGLETV